GPDQSYGQHMHGKIENVIALRIELVEMIIQCERIHTHQAGHGEKMPHPRNVAEMLDVGIIDNKNMIVKNKIKLEGLAVNQKPGQKENCPSQ
ncbi:MAG: hypothetical protein HQL14_08510, partial [Candidatus Omnitrophica bacterium]|nr:hypothetical protein [Candidatus Omnitrophota bacterium]